MSRQHHRQRESTVTLHRTNSEIIGKGDDLRVLRRYAEDLEVREITWNPRLKKLTVAFIGSTCAKVNWRSQQSMANWILNWEKAQRAPFYVSLVNGGHDYKGQVSEDNEFLKELAAAS